jgi:hypothetical protein
LVVFSVLAEFGFEFNVLVFILEVVPIVLAREQADISHSKMPPIQRYNTT